jgi:hypothetical protein
MPQSQTGATIPVVPTNSIPFVGWDHQEAPTFACGQKGHSPSENAANVPVAAKSAVKMFINEPFGACHGTRPSPPPPWLRGASYFFPQSTPPPVSCFFPKALGAGSPCWQGGKWYLMVRACLTIKPPRSEAIPFAEETGASCLCVASSIQGRCASSTASG